MKTLLLVITALSLTLSAYAGEGKKVTLNGKGVCAHCNLDIAKSCANVLQVKNDEGKLVNYLLTGKAVEGQSFSKKPHSNLTVTGTVVEEDGKLILKATSLEKKKDKES